MNDSIVIIGLGYVGLPLAILFAEKYENVIGFDVNERYISELNQGISTLEDVSSDKLVASNLKITSRKDDIKEAAFYIVAVPTPVDRGNRPDFGPLKNASSIIGEVLGKGSIVCYESTVYPGATEEKCVPVLERVSSLKCGEDFFIGYSPERINPGDKIHTLENIVKVVSGQTAEVADKLTHLYSKIITAGVHRVSSIKVAEATKIIENTQRDVNIALMNELAQILDLFGVPTYEVLEAARTKWNFLNFVPGLVGGHCIGVDPYYLAYSAQERGYIPELILSGRRINDQMSNFIVNKTIKLMFLRNMTTTAKVGIMGLTFKENIADLRNSKIYDMVYSFQEFGLDIVIHDPLAEASKVEDMYGLKLCTQHQLYGCNVIILAVPHRQFTEDGIDGVVKYLGTQGGIIIDVKSTFSKSTHHLPENITYWTP